MSSNLIEKMALVHSSQFNDVKPSRKRKRSIFSRTPEEIRLVYTDIIALEFSPTSSRVALGSNFGQFAVIGRDSESNEAFLEMKCTIPEETSIQSITWKNERLILASRDCVRLYDLKPFDKYSTPFFADKPLAQFDVQGSEVNAIQLLGGGKGRDQLASCCKDSKIKIFDFETQRISNIISIHKDSVDAISSNNEFFATGGKDGRVFIFDAALRTVKPIISFDFKKTPVNSISISKYSTWVCVGMRNIATPPLLNLRNGQELPPLQLDSSYSSRFRHHIFTVRFDSQDNLYWGGEGGILFKSEFLQKTDGAMKAQYGNGEINHIYSIATSPNSDRICVSGSSNTLLFSDNGKYWDTYINF